MARRSDGKKSLWREILLLVEGWTKEQFWPGVYCRVSAASLFEWCDVVGVSTRMHILEPKEAAVLNIHETIKEEVDARLKRGGCACYSWRVVIVTVEVEHRAGLLRKC